MTATAPLDQPVCLRRPVVRSLCLRAPIARAITARVLARVPVRAVLPDGTTLGGADSAEAPTMEILRPTALFERIAHSPKIGVGEGYMAGDWRAAPGTDLAEVFAPFAERLSSLVPSPLLWLGKVVDRRLPRAQRNTLLGSRRNIEAHYDLGNDLFEAFLDETLSYSSARFDHDRPRAGQSLAEAQLRKIHGILDLAEVGPGTSVLEIGTGWGSLAIEAARRGAQVTSITLSREQADLAMERIARADADHPGLSDRVEIRLQDYREVEGTFDAVVSVEMIEAVGEDYWPTYFETLEQRLAPGGVAAIQSILMAHDRYLATRNSWGWIQKHIFPGGLIPSLRAVEETTRGRTDLRVTAVDAFGADYAETLRRWRAAFLAARPTLDGYDEVFRRKWEFYLAYSEAGFATDYLDVAWIRLEREGVQVAE